MATPGCSLSVVPNILSAIDSTSSLESFSIAETFWIAKTGFPSTLGSRRAISSPTLIPSIFLDKLIMGTGQNKPFEVTMFSDTLVAFFLSIYPSRGVKYPAPNMTAFAAAAEFSSKWGIFSDAFIRDFLSEESSIYSGFKLSEPWGAIKFFIKYP